VHGPVLFDRRRVACLPDASQPRLECKGVHPQSIVSHPTAAGLSRGVRPRCAAELRVPDDATHKSAGWRPPPKKKSLYAKIDV
jgi:hypothetical protein